MTKNGPVNIKQRLIGAIILVSLGVIIIPFLLNGGSDINQAITGSNIPSMPARLEKTLPDFPQADPMPDAKSISSRPVTAGDSMSSLPPATYETGKKPRVNKQPKVQQNDYQKATRPTTDKIDTAYTLQIASFSQLSNATALRDKLRKAGHKAYIESIFTDKGKLYRLRVGPYLKFKQISAIQKKIEQHFKLSQTVIVHYKT